MTAPSDTGSSRPAAGWLVPIGAVVGVVGGVLIWFKPIGYGHGKHFTLGVSAHSFQGGLVGVFAPILFSAA